MNGWFIPESIVCLAVLVLATIALPTRVRRAVGGSHSSYWAMECGLFFLVIAEVLKLAVILLPEWSAYLTPFGIQLPIRAGGFLLLLLGFLSFVRDFKEAQCGACQIAANEHQRAESACLQEAKLRAILNCATEYCIIGSGLDGCINYYSSGGQRILGWQADEVIGQLNVAQFYPLWKGPLMADVEAAIGDKGVFEAELSLVRKDGKAFPALLTLTALTDVLGAPAGYVAVVKDITAIREVQNALRQERDFVQGIIETSELAIVNISLLDGRINLFNHGAELITGYDRQEVLGREYAEVLMAPEDRDRIRESLARGRAGQVPLIGQRQHTILTRSGERRIIAWTYTASQDDKGRPSHIVGFGHDVTAERRMQASLEEAKTELERANVELARLAATDPLTDLVNRRQADLLFDRELARARRAKSPTSVIMLDIDHFKVVNDTYGHKVGDAVLVHVADLLKRRLRAADIVARYGGEEFLLILSDTDLAGAVHPGGEVAAEPPGQPHDAGRDTHDADGKSRRGRPYAGPGHAGR